MTAALTGGVWAQKANQNEPTWFGTDVQAGLNYADTAGECYVGPGSYTITPPLTIPGKCFFHGGGPLATLLLCAPTGTGVAMREKTVGEGNPSGATGIVIWNMGLYGNGSACTFGLDLGNSGGANLNALGSVDLFIARDFTSGRAIRIQANAVDIGNIWGLASQVGVEFNSGGANRIGGLWAEANSECNLRLTSSPYNHFDYVQLEHNGVVASTCMLDWTGTSNQNDIDSLYMSLSGNTDKLVIERTGINRTQYGAVRVVTNGFTYNRTIYHEAVASGPTNSVLSGYKDQNSDFFGFYDSSTGRESKITGAVFQPYQCDVVNNLSVGGTSQFTGNVSEGVAGTGCLHTVGAGTTGADFASIRIRSGSGGGQSRVLFNQNGTDLANIFITATATFFEQLGTLTWRNGVGGASIASLTTAGAFSTTSLAATGLTNGKYTKAGASGVLTDGPTPLAGTKVYFVSDTSGGAVNRKLTFTDGILTAET